MLIESTNNIFAQLFSNRKICGCYCLRPVEVLNFPPKMHAALPLRHIDYQIDITNGLASITLEQKYINPTQKFLEIEFSFPIDPNACIYRYVAEFGKNRIQGIVKQKQQAKKEYQQAILSGKQASYAQIDPNSKDIMNMQIGNIGPGQQVKIIISYLQQLNVELNTFYQFHLPSTISPRYMDIHMGKRYNPEIKQTVGYYTWNFKITLQTSRKIVLQQSKSHKLQVLNQNQKGNQMILVLAQQQLPNTDLHFLYTTQDFHLPNFVLGRTDVSSTVMLSFIPKFCELSVDDAMKASLSKKQLQTDINATKGEYIFFLDRSGSMHGDRINKAKEALILFLRSLPENTYFNIVSFGDNSVKMFTDSVKFDKNNLQKAIQNIQKMGADMGCTEIYKGLSVELKRKVIEGYPKQIFILTDGGVSNTQNVIKLVAQNTKYTRCHAIGIGNGCSEALVKGCAQEGKGKYIFITDNENPSQKIIGLLEQTLTPVIDNIKLDYDKKLVASIVPNPNCIPYILKNQVVNFYVTLQGQLEKKTNFTFSYKDSLNNILYKSQIQIDPQSINMPFVDKMAQNKVIKNLQTSLKENSNIEDFMYFVKAPKDKKQQAIKHSIKHQILSQFTAFICVNKQLVDGKYQQIQDKGKDKVHIPNLLPFQYQKQQQNLQSIMLKTQNLMSSSMNFQKCVSKSRSNIGGAIKGMIKSNQMASKKSSSGLGIGNVFSSIGSSIVSSFQGLFSKKQQSLSFKQTEDIKRNKVLSYSSQQYQAKQKMSIQPIIPLSPMRQQNMKMMAYDKQQDQDEQMQMQCDMICQMACVQPEIISMQIQDKCQDNKKSKKNIKKTQSIQFQQKKPQLPAQPKPLPKKPDINTIISHQNIDGSFQSQNLIQSLITSQKYNTALTQSKSFNISIINIIISYLIGKYIQKYYPEKQYVLIVKKIYSFIKKTNKLEELQFLDKYIV